MFMERLTRAWAAARDWINHRANRLDVRVLPVILTFMLVFCLGGCIGLSGQPGGTGSGGGGNPGAPPPASGQLSASPVNLTFGQIPVGSTADLGVKLTNTGKAAVTISGVSISAPGFNANGVGSGVVLPPNQAATLTVTFDPPSAGSLSGTITVTSDAPMVTIQLSGQGIAAARHSATLTWSESDATVVSYNAYRSNSADGQFAKLNTSPITQLNFTDSTVQSGQTYSWMVTSVDAGGNESDPSATVSATIPSP